MKRNRFSEEQIIGILKEHEAGMPVAELCRRHGVSDASIYKWKAKYGGMDVSETKRLRGLEEENAKLKRMLADARRLPCPGGQPNRQKRTHIWIKLGGNVTAYLGWRLRPRPLADAAWRGPRKSPRPEGRHPTLAVAEEDIGSCKRFAIF